MEPYEVYVLCRNRSAHVGLEFLNTFLPHRTPVAVEFPYPEFDDPPKTVYYTPEELMQRLTLEPNNTYSIYWDDDDVQSTRQAMLFFTDDGGMIAGLAIVCVDPTQILLEVAKVVGGRFGFITSENPPPTLQSEFIDVCQKATLPTLVDGKLLNGDSMLK